MLSAPGGADRERLGAILDAGHTSLRDDLEVSIPGLDLLVELALAAGAVTARMTGGGFDDSVAAGYRDRTGRTATVHRCVTVDRAGEIARS